MNNIKPIIFLIPGIALLLVVWLFIYLLKKANDRKIFKRFVLSLLVLGFLFNYAWELIQMPLYKAAPFNFGHIAFCALASVADAIMVLLIYFGFALIYKDSFWIREMTAFRISLLMLVGGIGAVAAEMRHLSYGTWAYDSSMPILPVVHVGLSPVLQFMLLPFLIFYLGRRFTGSGRLSTRS